MKKSHWKFDGHPIKKKQLVIDKHPWLENSAKVFGTICIGFVIIFIFRDTGLKDMFSEADIFTFLFGYIWTAYIFGGGAIAIFWPS